MLTVMCISNSNHTIQYHLVRPSLLIILEQLNCIIEFDLSCLIIWLGDYNHDDANDVINPREESLPDLSSVT